MPRAVRPDRKVIVNMNPGGRFHELTCRWLTGAFNASLSQANYREMPISQVPAGKKHCSRC
jgi:hypothetical protein